MSAIGSTCASPVASFVTTKTTDFCRVVVRLFRVDAEARGVGWGRRSSAGTSGAAPARLRLGARHVEAAEGVYADERARALPVEVQVADVELARGALQLLRV